MAERVWCYRLAVRTKDSQSLNRGSIPRSTTKKPPIRWLFLFLIPPIWIFVQLYRGFIEPLSNHYRTIIGSDQFQSYYPPVQFVRFVRPSVCPVRRHLMPTSALPTYRRYLTSHSPLPLPQVGATVLDHDAVIAANNSHTEKRIERL